MVRIMLSCLLAVAACSGSLIAPHILGGSDANITDYPYMLSIVHKGSGHLCGGFIISSNWLLTDAWCALDPLNLSEFTIRSGSAELYTGTFHNAVQWIRHPLNKVHVKEYDVALVQVDPPFEFGEKVAAVTLAAKDQETPDGASALIAGWRVKNRTDSGISTKYLQVAKTTVLAEAACSEILASDFQYSKLCVQNPNGIVSNCYLEEGGPLVIDGTAFGVILYPHICNDPLAVQVYTRIASVRNWIDATIGA